MSSVRRRSKSASSGGERRGSVKSWATSIWSNASKFLTVPDSSNVLTRRRRNDKNETTNSDNNNNNNSDGDVGDDEGTKSSLWSRASSFISKSLTSDQRDAQNGTDNSNGSGRKRRSPSPTPPEPQYRFVEHAIARSALSMPSPRLCRSRAKRTIWLMEQLEHSMNNKTCLLTGRLALGAEFWRQSGGGVKVVGFSLKVNACGQIIEALNNLSATMQLSPEDSDGITTALKRTCADFVMVQNSLSSALSCVEPGGRLPNTPPPTPSESVESTVVVAVAEEISMSDSVVEKSEYNSVISGVSTKPSQPNTAVNDDTIDTDTVEISTSNGSTLKSGRSLASVIDNVKLFGYQVAKGAKRLAHKYALPTRLNGHEVEQYVNMCQQVLHFHILLTDMLHVYETRPEIVGYVERILEFMRTCVCAFILDDAANSFFVQLQRVCDI